MDPQKHTAVEAVSAEESLILLQCRSSLRRDSMMNIAGTIRCKSEILKIKTDRLFMIKLQNGPDVILKKEQKLDWHGKLMLHKQFIFTGVIPTSLHKGGSKKHEVYAVTEDSNLYVAEHVQHRLLTATEWIAQYGTTCRLPDSSASAVGRQIKDGGQSECGDLFSYQGTITAVLDGSLAVYELDSAVRLYAGIIPTENRLSVLRVGTKLMIHNAHYKLKTKNSKLSLYCCVLSSIQLDSSVSPIDVRIGHTVQKLLYCKRLSLFQLDYLYELKSLLHRQLQNCWGTRQVERVFSVVLKIPDVCRHFLSCKSRNVLDEFLSEPHSCGFLSNTQEIPLSFHTVKQVLEQRLKREPAGQNSQWQYIVSTSEMNLIGILNSCANTGQLFIQDDTGRIDIVVCCCHSNTEGGGPRFVCVPAAGKMPKVEQLGNCVRNPQTSVTLLGQSADERLWKTNGTTCLRECLEGEKDDVESNGKEKQAQHFSTIGHGCSEQCICVSSTSGARFECPYVHACCLGKLVIVSRYRVVCEVRPSEEEKRKSRERHSGTKRYLVFDMRCVTCLGVPVDSSIKPMQRDSRKSHSKTKSCVNQDAVVGSEVTREGSCDIVTSVHSRCKVNWDSEKGNGSNVESRTRRKLVVHKHFRSDGGIVYCRKPDCVGSGEQLLCQSVAGERNSGGNAGLGDTVAVSEFITSGLVAGGKEQVERYRRSKDGMKLTSTSETEPDDSDCVITKVVPSVGSNHSRTEKEIVSKKAKVFIPKFQVIGTQTNVRKRKSDEDLQTDENSCKLDRNFTKDKSPIECICLEDKISDTCNEKHLAVCEKNKSTIKKQRPECRQMYTSHAKENLGMDGHQGAVVYKTFNKGSDASEVLANHAVEKTSNRAKDVVCSSDSSVEEIKDVSHCGQLSEVDIFVENRGCVLMEKGSGTMPDQRRFIAECDLNVGTKIFKVCLCFSHQLVRYHPVLQPFRFYNLTLSPELSPLLSLAVNHGKVLQAAIKSKSRVVLSVHREVRLRELYDVGSVPRQSLTPLPKILQPHYLDGVVSFQGHIAKRMSITPDRNSRGSDMDCLGTPGQCVRLLIQDTEENICKIWVYVNERDTECPLGLLPGATAIFHSLERKIAKTGNVYCRLLAFSSVNILGFETPSSEDRESCQPDSSMDFYTEKLPVLFLADVWNHDAVTTFQCVCDVQKVSKVSLKCVCSVCGSEFVRKSCSNKQCREQELYIFHARASIVIDDGTSVAMVTLRGSKVQHLLKLSHDQWTSLEQLVCQTGEVFVQQIRPDITTDLELFVYKLCESRDVKQMWKMALKQNKLTVDINKIHTNEFAQKDFDTGTGHVTTRCLPFLQMECQALVDFDPQQYVLESSELVL